MKTYIAKCKCGKVVAAAIANTPAEQADCAKDVKEWIKKGFSVKLVSCGPKRSIPAWCDNRGRCKEVSK